MSDHNRISPYNINTILKQTSDDNKEKISTGGFLVDLISNSLS